MLLKYLLIAVIGYLLGNFNTGLIVSKAQSGIDIRKHGSGNAGATNMLRVLGNQSALLTIVGDVLKGIIAIWIGQWIAGYYGGLLGGTAAVIGHDWPIFFGFKGGKGVATSFGVLAYLFPLHGLLCLAVFLIVFFATRYVSLSSMAAAVVGALAVCITGWGDLWVCGAALLWAALIVVRHHTNIARLRAGTESKLTNDYFKSKKKVAK